MTSDKLFSHHFLEKTIEGPRKLKKIPAKPCILQKAQPCQEVMLLGSAGNQVQQMKAMGYGGGWGKGDWGSWGKGGGLAARGLGPPQVVCVVWFFNPLVALLLHPYLCMWCEGLSWFCELSFLKIGLTKTAFKDYLFSLSRVLRQILA